jgi:hypothetical protein
MSGGNFNSSRDQEVYRQWNNQRRRACWVEVLTHLLTNSIFVSRLRKALDLLHCGHFQSRNVPVHRFTSSIVNSLGIVQRLDPCLPLDPYPIREVSLVGLSEHRWLKGTSV